MLTMPEILAEMPPSDAKTHWESCPDFPPSALAPEALSILHTAAAVAANKKNANLDPGEQIAAFPFPTYGAPSIDADTGLETAIKTTSVVTRVPINNDAAIGQTN